MDEIQSPDTGSATIFGRDAATAQRAGDFAVVWQDLALCDNLSVIANLCQAPPKKSVIATKRVDKSNAPAVNSEGDKG